MNRRVIAWAPELMMLMFNLLVCHPAPWRNYPPLFVPGPQFCPDTGRTVCAAVDYYPTERVYNLLTSARAQVFNLSSLFVDERKGDVEPNMSLILMQPYYQNGDDYGPNQPTPGGRFSPAGRNVGDDRTGWNTPAGSPRGPVSSLNGDGPLRPREQQERWRQGSPQHNNGEPGSVYRNANLGAGGEQGDVSGFQQPADPNNSRWSRARVQNQRNTPYVKVPQSRSVTPHTVRDTFLRPPSSTDPQYPSNPYNNADVTEFNSAPVNGQHDGQRFFNQPNYPKNNGYQQPNKQNPEHVGEDMRGFPRRAVHQMQFPYIERNVKGKSISRSTFAPIVPHSVSTWKGPPTKEHHGIYNDRAPDRFYGPDDSPLNNNVKRGKRNRDVEVACQVQSTFVPPRAALSDQSEWKYIVNVPERDQRFSQVVRVDVCLTEGQPCSSRLSLPFGFTSRCRQKYIKKKLLSLNPDGQGTGEDNFFIPSCCVCEITRLGKK